MVVVNVVDSQVSLTILDGLRGPKIVFDRYIYKRIPEVKVTKRSGIRTLYILKNIIG